MKILAGTVLVLETGEYSDYCFIGPFKVLKEFDQAESVRECVAQWVAPSGGWKDEPETDDFIGWLSKNGYIEEMDYVSWHIGSYSRLKPVIQPSAEEIEAAKKLKYELLKAEAARNPQIENKPWIKKAD